jgi:3-oxoacyl-[acyl-carrier protein] reductase
LSEAGAKIAIAGRNSTRLNQVAEQIENRGGDGLAVVADVTKESDVEDMVARVLDRYKRVDILVNNAGQIIKRKVIDTTTAEWDNIIAVNLRGTFLCTRAVLSAMIRQRNGKIINISSTGGRRANPATTAYASSKFGVSGFSESLAQEMAERGITVTSVCPGLVASDMTRAILPGADTSKWLDPKDVGELVVFLATRPSRVLIPEVFILASEADYFRQ